MAAPGASNRRIQTKHILIALVGILTTLIFIASIVMLAIGYMNPFGTIGLGILGGGCIMYFSGVIFLCACGIWIKNRYYADEMDYRQKLDGSSSEELSLIKTVSSSEQPEVEWVKGTDIQDGNRNPSALFSVSTVYTSVSSSASVADNWQRDVSPGALDSDVFSSSLTAIQYSDIKSQQELDLSNCTSELPESTGQKLKDSGERQHANIAVTDKRNYVTEAPQKYKPVDIYTMKGLPSPPYYVPQSNHDKQVQKGLTDGQSVVTENTYSSKVKELGGRKVQFGPDSQTTSTFQPTDYKVDLQNELQKVKDKGRLQHNTQTTDRHESSFPNFAMPKARRPNKEGVNLDNALPTVPASDLYRKHRPWKKDRPAIPLQYRLPKSQQGLSSSQTTTDDVKKKGIAMRKGVNPAVRTHP